MIPGLSKFNLRRISIFIVIGVVLLLVMNFNTRLEELGRLQNEAATVRAQATGVMVTQAGLETQLAFATSQAAVEEFAREQSHMIKPGDTVLEIVPAPGATAAPLPTPTPVQAQITNWDIWMFFLFGK